MKIGVITPLYPTSEEPYRGAAIWNTLRALETYADISVYCVHPRYPFVRPRSFRYQTQPADTLQYGLPAQMVSYFAVPWATRMWNTYRIRHRLKSGLKSTSSGGSLDLLLCYWIGPESCAAVRLGQELGVPVILGARGTDLAKPSKNLVVRKQVGRAIQHAEAVLCVSGDLARKAEAMGAASDRVFTIPNGVDRTVFDSNGAHAARARLRISPECRLAVFVGWLSKVKGVSQLVEALSMLNQRDPGGWRLAVIGEGYLRNAVSRQVAKLGLTGQVLLLGPKRQVEVADWLKAADVLCLPSETEGCPNVVLEALSVGTPVLVTAVGGIPELVNDDCSILIHTRKPEDIAQGLRSIAARTWDRPAIARTCGRGWDQVAKETYRVCEWVMEKHRETSESAYVTQ
jgi:teichuronic acid biosynthesis glycosyltransferase TuaC